MNRVGIKGAGESVWLGFFLCAVLREFAAVARSRGDPAFAERCRRAGGARCATTSSSTAGTASGIGARTSTTARRWARPATSNAGSIRSPQSWSVLSGAGDAERSRSGHERRGRAPGAPRSTRSSSCSIRPSTDRSSTPATSGATCPGVRENGGQYTHGAIWAAMAFAALGDSDRAWELTSMINPVNHARSPAGHRDLQGGALCHRRRRLRGGAAHRPRRLDLVHGLGGLDVPAHRRIAARR